MKKRLLIVVLTLAALAAALGSCGNTVDEEETGAITISIGVAAGGRAVAKWPVETATMGRLAHKVILTRTSPSAATKEHTFAAGAATVASIPVAPGTWTVTVEAYIGSVNGVLYATGTGSVTVAAGETKSVPITMSHAGYTVTSKDDWEEVLGFIQNGGNVKSYIINVSGNVAVTGTTTPTFGSVTGLEVTLKGSGKLYLDSPGSLLMIGIAGQTVVLDSAALTLEGTTGNTSSLVTINNGAFKLKNGKVTDNTSTTNGGGVNLGTNATFDMYGGEISGNAGSNGGGVYVGGGSTFTMYGGEISGNTAGPNTGNGGGGVYLYGNGKLLIVTGTIYGTDAATGANTLTGTASGTALYLSSTGGTAQRGTFTGTNDEWVSKGSLAITTATTTETTINVVNGEIYDPNAANPTANDYTVTGLTQTAGSVVAVSITPKAGSGAVTATYYEGISPTVYTKQTNVPSAVGTYAVTFDVGAATGWNAATGLSAGTLTVNAAATGNTFTVTNYSQWDGVVTIIKNGGANKSYTITVNGDVGVVGDTINTFGTVTGLKVTLKGSGKLYLSSQGNLLAIKANQEVILDSDDLTLQGLKSGQNGFSQDNDAMVVNIATDGTFTMNGGKVSDNTNTFTVGGGVYVATGATFNMTGGVISGNTSSTSGGGVYNAGTFRIVNGTIYGSGEGALSNTAASGAALESGGTAQRGTFSGTNSAWVSKGTLTSTSNTIAVYNGMLESEFDGVFNVANAGDWSSFYNNTQIFSGTSGATKSYLVNVIAEINNVVISDTSSYTFGSKSYIDVVINGNGHSVALNSTSQSFLLYVGNNQNVAMNNLTLKGNPSNNSALVLMGGGAITMNSGSISDNTNASPGGTGGGVYMNGGTFTMNGGDIAGNKASAGGGVYMIGNSTPPIFTMYGGRILGNTATVSNGGGMFLADGTLSIVTGTIYGNNAGALSNFSGDGDSAAFAYSTATVRYGNGVGTWTTLYPTNNTIDVLNGALQ